MSGCTWAFNSHRFADIKIRFSTSFAVDLSEDVYMLGENSAHGASADVRSFVGGRCYFAHKLVLANASPVLCAPLENWAEGDAEDDVRLKVLHVPVEEGELDAAEELLRFM